MRRQVSLQVNSVCPDVFVNVLPNSVIVALSASDDQITFKRVRVVKMVLHVTREKFGTDGDEVAIAASTGCIEKGRNEGDSVKRKNRITTDAIFGVASQALGKSSEAGCHLL